MGTDIYLLGMPKAPQNLPEVQAAVWKQRRPLRLYPYAAKMVLMAKVTSKLLRLAHVYCPRAQEHAANGALMVRGCKHMTATSRHANTDALWGPEEHGCQGLAWSSHSWQVAVVSE